MTTKIFSLNKKEIKQTPFHLIYEDGLEGTNQRKSFAKYSIWALPQALAYLGKFTPVRNAEGKCDGNLTAKAIINSSDMGPEWVKGLFFYLISNPRGTIFPVGVKASSPELLPFSALVPLVLAAFKKYQGVKYSEWVNIKNIVDADLFAAMDCTPPEYSTDELLELRLLGTTVKTGDKAGTIKNPASATSITSTGFPEFDQLPRLAKIMLTQIWVAHPNYRHEYMVLSPNDWDKIPTSLISTEVIKETKHDLWD